MSFIVNQNTPTIVDLAAEARTMGWTLDGGIAKHEACNAGFIQVIPSVVPVVVGQSYTISYQVSSLTSGMLQMSIGDTLGNVRTTTGNFTETLIATGSDPVIRFYADGVAWLNVIDVRSNFENTTTKQRNAFGFNDKTNKWETFYSFTSDFGFSLFKDSYTLKGGRLYKHDVNSTTRNVIYNNSYDTVVSIPFNSAIGQTKTFESISYESNQLLITTVDGIKTSIGQLSTLMAGNFLVETLKDGVNEVRIYDREGIYAAGFMRESTDVVNGSVLKGTYVIIELTTLGNDILSLKNVLVNSVVSKTGSR